MITPELYVTDLDENITFFVEVLGFTVKYSRPEEDFVYFTFQGSALMLEGLGGNSRKWLTGDMTVPFGRGINLQWQVSKIDVLFARVQKHAPDAIFLPLEHKTYVCGGESITQSQFIAQTPDGYLLRFCEDVNK